MLTHHVPGRLTLLACACSAALLGSGCSSINDLVSGDKIDYRSSGNKTVTLEVPPDLSQLSGQGRYTHAATGSVSANAFNQQAQVNQPATSQGIAPQALGGVTLERDGQVRWLSVNQPPEAVWQQVRDFWVENGFELTVDQAKTGLLQTNWSENRAKLAQDGLRQLMGRLIDNLYDTGERDQFVTRIERTSRGSEIYISHRGLQEIYTDSKKEQTTWKARPADPALEAEMLSRLMVKLGTSKDAAQAAVTADNSTRLAPRSRVLPDGVTVQVGATDFDQAWRRVGLALDRGGFTVEDRDRSRGIYEVRLAAPGNPEGEKPGLFGRVFGWFGGSQAPTDTLTRYRLLVLSQGGSSTVAVQNPDGKAADSAGGREVARMLMTNLE